MRELHQSKPVESQTHIFDLALEVLDKSVQVIVIHSLGDQDPAEIQEKVVHSGDLSLDLCTLNLPKKQNMYILRKVGAWTQKFLSFV